MEQAPIKWALLRLSYAARVIPPSEITGNADRQQFWLPITSRTNCRNVTTSLALAKEISAGVLRHTPLISAEVRRPLNNSSKNCCTTCFCTSVIDLTAAAIICSDVECISITS